MIISGMRQKNYSLTVLAEVVLGVTLGRCSMASCGYSARELPGEIYRNDMALGKRSPIDLRSSKETDFSKKS
jgi:hypothetical protein